MVYSERNSTQKDTSSSAVTSSLSDLIARLERATGPDWRLSVEIFREVGLPDTFFGSKVISWFGDGPFGCNTEDGRRHLDCINSPPYTSSIDAAMTLVPEGFYWQITRGLDDVGCPVGDGITKANHSALVIDEPFTDNSKRVWVRSSPAIALCIAALKARSLPAI